MLSIEEDELTTQRDAAVALYKGLQGEVSYDTFVLHCETFEVLVGGENTKRKYPTRSDYEWVVQHPRTLHQTKSVLEPSAPSSSWIDNATTVHT